MECSEPVTAVKTQYHVQHWTKAGVERKTLDITVYPDETVARVLMKIAHAMGKTTIPYAWRGTPMLFTPDGPWLKNGYHVNPWKVTALPDAKDDPKLSFNFQQLIPKGILNISFKEDVKEELQNGYYFPNLGVKMLSKMNLSREDNILSAVWKPSDELPALEQCVYTHVEYHGALKVSMTPAEIFDTITASKQVPLVQWVDDRSRVLYKLYENHMIPAQTLQQWMQYERLPIVNGALIFYSPFSNNFARCVIDTAGTFQMVYHVDARDKLDLGIINTDREKVIKYISNLLKTKISVSMHNISMKTTMIKGEVNMKTLASVIGTLLPVFHIVQLASNSLDIIYKRSSNYNTIDVTETIKTLLQYGNMSPVEVAERLVNTYGFTLSEAKTYIDQASSLEDVATNKKIETGISMNISPAPLGFKVSIDQAPSLDEARCALHWIRSCVAVAATKVKPKVQAVLKKPVPKDPTPSPSSKSTSSESEQSLSDSLSVGGGIGNEYKGYFLNMLQKADPRIFVDSTDYARKCMVTNFRQPVVISKSDKDALDKQGYGKAIDNFIEYGSEASNQNVYFCPRIWCPESKIPLTPEQYEQNGRKCPSGEKAIQLYDHSYWDNDPNVPHMIGFHTAKSDKGFCLPCCMKRVPDEAKFAKKLKECNAPVADKPKSPKQQQAQDVADEKEEYYLMTQSAPIPKGRYGTVPKPMHNALFPNIAHAQCSKVLTSQECLVRKGIDHSDDSLVAALASAMGMKNKKEWVKWVKKNLDPLRFITLENGNILTMFVSSNAFVPKDHTSMVAKWKAWVSNHTKYVKVFQLQSLIDKMDNYSENELYILSRELAVYDAYTRFMDYLQSPEVKNPFILYDLLKHMGVLLLLWERQDNDNAYLYCPLYSSIDEILGALSVSQKAIMLLKEGDMYEPLELKQRNKQGVETISFQKAQPMMDMLFACDPKENVMQRVVTNLISYDMWIDEALVIPSQFRIHTLILTSDMKIGFGLTKANILIKMPYGGIPLGYLDRIMESLHIKQILHHDDIEGHTYTAKFIGADLNWAMNKLSENGFGVHAGEIVTTTTYNNVPLYETLVTVPPSLTYPTIRTEAKTHTGFKEKDKQWYQIRMMIGKTLLNHYETLTKELQSMPRSKWVPVLMNTFPMIKDKKFLQAVIEEVPMKHGKDAIANWLRRASYPLRYPFLDLSVHKKNKQYIFSQVAVEHGLPRDVLTPSKGSRPSEGLEPVKQQERPLSQSQTTFAIAMALPSLFKTSLESLPSKWTQIKNYQWAKFKMGVIAPYTRDSAWELFTWVAAQLQVTLNRDDLEMMRNKKVTNALKNADLMAVFLEDPSMLHEWNAAVGKKYVDGKQLLQKVFVPQIQKANISPLVDYWRMILDKKQLWFSDLDIYMFVNSVPCNVIVLHRSPYGTGSKKRGDIEDLAVSSTFFTREYTMSYVQTKPIIILYKTLHDTHAQYSPIVDEAGMFLFKTILQSPKDVQELVKHHVQNKINRMM